MNKRLLSGLLLVAIGILFLVLSMMEFRSKEELFRVGDFSASATTKRTVPALRYVGIGFFAAGVILAGIGFKSGK